MRLQDGEQKKFNQEAYTNNDSGVTLTGDEIIGEILTTNSALLPFTVTEFGQLGSLAQHFLYGTIDAMPCHNSRMTKSM